jgi:hypothetical protein
MKTQTLLAGLSAPAHHGAFAASRKRNTAAPKEAAPVKIGSESQASA